jgi:hypothetical protein
LIWSMPHWKPLARSAPPRHWATMRGNSSSM